MRHALFFAASIFSSMVPAVAQQNDTCSGFKWSVDSEKAAFASTGLQAVSTGAALPAPKQAVILHLAKQDGLTFDVPPMHKPKNSPAFAGSFPLTASEAGSYQVTLSEDAWIDVVQNGKLLRQSGFTGSHDCTAVRKSVRFTLARGPATVLISDAQKDSLKLDMLPQSP